jgi:hypothetical protein
LAVRRLNFRREDGVAMTEFALILPVFMFIVLGLLAFGRAFWYWIDANHLANETARWAVVDRNPYAPVTLQQHIRDSSTVEFRNSVKVCIDFPDGGTPEVGDRVRVRVQKPFSAIPLLDIKPITITAASTMRIERFADGSAPTTYAAGSPYGACS